MKYKVMLAVPLVMALPALALAQSNVDPLASFAWGENIGWCNFYGDGTNGAVMRPGTDVLSGYVWSENEGWIHLGDGTPDTPPHYSNASATDYGVNHDGAGGLYGYAWGENIGWIDFDTSGDGGSQVTVTPAGVLGGYAWSENEGWVNMGEGAGITAPPPPGWFKAVGGWRGVRLADSDDDDLADAFETNDGTWVSPYETGSDPSDPDTDDDGLMDGDEVCDLDPDTAGIQNPFDPLVSDSTGDDGDDFPDGVPDGDNDYDGDGYTNEEESAWGSNPTSPDSLPVPASSVVGLVILCVALLVAATRLPALKRALAQP